MWTLVNPNIGYSLKKVASAISGYRVDYILNNDLVEHKVAFKPTLDAINSLALTNFDLKENVFNNLKYYSATPKIKATINLGNDISSTLIGHDNLKSTVAEFANVSQHVFSRFDFIKNHNIEEHQKGIMYLCEFKKNKCSLRDYITTRIDESINLDPSLSIEYVSNLLSEKLLISDIPHLMTSVTLLQSNMPVTVLAFNYALVLILGPAAFIGVYTFMNKDNNTEMVIKNSLYNKQMQKDLAYMNHFMFTQVAPTIMLFGVTILLPVFGNTIGNTIFSFISNYSTLPTTKTRAPTPILNYSTPTPTPTTTKTREVIKAFASTLVVAGSNHVPTPEKNPYLYPVRTLVKNTTFAVADTFFSAFKGVYQAYLTNIYESTTVITDAILNNPEAVGEFIEGAKNDAILNNPEAVGEFIEGAKKK